MAPARTRLEVQRRRSSVYTLHAHLVFVIKYRRPVFNDRMLTFGERLMTTSVAISASSCEGSNGENDHLHLVVNYPPSLSISTMINPTQRAPHLAGDARTTLRTFGNTYGAITSGSRPTSPPPTAALRYRS